MFASNEKEHRANDSWFEDFDPIDNEPMKRREEKRDLTNVIVEIDLIVERANWLNNKLGRMFILEHKSIG